MRIREAWVRSRRRLERACITDAGLEAQVLLRDVLGIDRVAFFASLSFELGEGAAEALERSVRRRVEGEPLSYITGRREFYGSDLVVTPDVLVPRQETELLVEAVLEYAGGRAGTGASLTIADVGTGSGAIAIALGNHLPNATVYATDVSRGALQVADTNRHRHGLEGRIHLRHGDLFKALDGPVDVLVSNPPYLADAEVAVLPPDVRREPVVALAAGADGMDVLRRLIRGAPRYLNSGGMLAVELDPRRLDAVAGLTREVFAGGEVLFLQDQGGTVRLVTVTLPSA